MTLFLEHWDGTDPGVFAIHSNEWKLRGKLWLFMRWTNDIGKIDECKCNSKAKVHFVAVYFISLSIWQYCTALHCIRLFIVSAEFNIEWTQNIWTHSAKILASWSKYLSGGNHSILSSIILHSQVLAAGSRSNTFKATEVKRNLMSGMEWVKSAGHGSVLCGHWWWSVGSSLWAITQPDKFARTISWCWS